MQETFQINMVLFRKIDVGDERSKIELHGDSVLKMADQLRKWWENGVPNGAKVQDGTEECFCARWLRCQRDPIFSLAEMSDYHAIFCPIVHTWMLIREIANCGV